MNTTPSVQTMPIDRLKPAKYNPRKDLKPINPGYEKVKGSLHNYGHVDSIVFDVGYYHIECRGILGSFEKKNIGGRCSSTVYKL